MKITFQFDFAQDKKKDFFSLFSFQDKEKLFSKREKNLTEKKS